MHEHARTVHDMALLVYEAMGHVNRALALCPYKNPTWWRVYDDLLDAEKALAHAHLDLGAVMDD
jgi:hypothetical protein